MQFRNAKTADLSLIVEIYNSTISSRMVTADIVPVTVDEKLSWFNAHHAATRPLWMVEDNNTVVGWASFNNFYGRPAYNGTAEISIYLHPVYRQKGFGKKILAHCINEAPALNIHTLLGFIFAHNQPSIELFLQAGFSQWGNLADVAYMDGNPYSLLIFGKKTS